MAAANSGSVGRGKSFKDTSVIPGGFYCYKVVSDWIQPEDGSLPYFKTEMCPYWSIDKTRPSQNNGYCSFLEEGDWEHPGLGLLWDQVKECCENMEEDDYGEDA